MLIHFLSKLTFWNEQKKLRGKRKKIIEVHFWSRRKSWSPTFVVSFTSDITPIGIDRTTKSASRSVFRRGAIDNSMTFRFFARTPDELSVVRYARGFVRIQRHPIPPINATLRYFAAFDLFTRPVMFHFHTQNIFPSKSQFLIESFQVARTTFGSIIALLTSGPLIKFLS